jgi:hypothetical protein
MSRQFEWPNDRWGQGNWEPYPIAGRLFGDKVLMYQHDLYEETMTTDPETLLFNVAFGFVLSYAWDESSSPDSPWATLVGQVQRTLGPHYAGKRLTEFRTVEPGVTESVFEGGFSVLANWKKQAVEVDGARLAPQGFLARKGGEVLASALGFNWSGVSFPAGAR